MHVYERKCTPSIKGLGETHPSAQTQAVQGTELGRNVFFPPLLLIFQIFFDFSFFLLVQWGNRRNQSNKAADGPYPAAGPQDPQSRARTRGCGRQGWRHAHTYSPTHIHTTSSKPTHSHARCPSPTHTRRPSHSPVHTHKLKPTHKRTGAHADAYTRSLTSQGTFVPAHSPHPHPPLLAVTLARAPPSR